MVDVWRAAHEDALVPAAEAIAKGLRPGDVLALRGPLGAGKTTFTRYLVAALGGDAAAVTSPTFSLIDEHAIDGALLVHADLYRLNDREELFATGLADYLGAEDCICVVEWPDQAGGIDELVTCALAIATEDGARVLRFSREEPEIPG